MSPFKVRTIKFDDGERYPILQHSGTGIPLFIPTLYITTMRRSANRAANTLQTDLRAIMQLYTWASIDGVDIEDRFAHGQFLSVEEIEAVVRAARMKYDELVELHEFKDIVKPVSNVVSHERFRKAAPKKLNQVMAATGATRIRNIRDYLDWLATKSLSRTSTKSGEFEAIDAARNLMKESFTARLPKGGGRNVEGGREGLSSEVVDHILYVLNPESPENPFADAGTRVRNQIIFLLLLSLGIRRGECLGIKIEDINFQDDTLLIRRRADDPDDPRKDQPNAKTKDRKLELKPALVAILQEYIMDVRSKVPGAKKHTFLLVTHKPGKHIGKPLSHAGYSKFFSSLRDRVPGIPRSVTGHALRHTWNDKFSKLMDSKDVSEDQEKQMRAYMMGWSYDSEMAAVYTKRHIRKKAAEASLELQQKIMGKNNDAK